MTSLIYQFDRVASHYNGVAEPQQLVIDRLVQLIREHLLQAERHFTHAFEMSIGSGLSTERIDQLLEIDHWAPPNLSSILLVQVPRLRGPCLEMRVGDASESPLEGLGIDLFVPSSAIQWLSDPCVYLQRIVRELSGETTMVTSTFGPDNLPEVHQLTDQGLRYPSLATQHYTLQEPGYPYGIHTERLVILFVDLLIVLQHLHHTGAAQSSDTPRQIRAPNQLRHFTKEYIATSADKTG